MVNLYTNRIEAEKMTLEQVPTLWREKVRLELEVRQQVELTPVPEEVTETELQ